MKLVTRDGKSNIILLERVADILSEQWYNERKTNIFNESERVIKTAAKLITKAIKNPDGRYMFKVNNRNPRTRCEICSKLTIKIPERRQSRRSGVFIVNFEHISHLVLLFLLLTLSR